MVRQRFRLTFSACLKMRRLLSRGLFALAAFRVSAMAVAADSLPIGVFDSGIGGLTVLEKLMAHPGLKGERYTYLGDQANMPYGNYAAAGKSAYLRELVIKDALFLISDGYFTDGAAESPRGVKDPAKVVVIACNTATAYGRDAADAVFKCAGARQRVIGVINAGVRSMLRQVGAAQATGLIAVGVLATPGTIASGAYPRTVERECARQGIKASVMVFSQGCPGLADAIELGTADADPIARDNLRSLVAQYRKSGVAAPLKAVILGCTHYPFLMPALEKTRAELGQDFVFVDPAVDTAEECYRVLKEDGRLAERGSDATKVDVFVSVPSDALSAKCRAADGTLAQSYKYGRDAGRDEVTTKFVPLANGTVDPVSLSRLVNLLPLTRAALQKNGDLK